MNESREVAVKIAAKHPEALGAGILLKEIAGLGLATPPGLSSFSGGRPKPSPVIRLFSYLTPKDSVDIQLEMNGETLTMQDAPGVSFDATQVQRPPPPYAPTDTEIEIPLIKLAWARSGDKGDKANIGVIARKPEYLPYIWTALTEKSVAERLAHFIEGGGDPAMVDRFFLPGSNAINFLIDKVLGGGGVASLRNDPQGKGYAQLLLAQSSSCIGNYCKGAHMTVFQTKVNTSSDAFKENHAEMSALVSKLKELNARAPAKSAQRKDRFEARGQLLPRERLARLLDPGMPYFEISNIAGYLLDTEDEEKSVPGSTIMSGNRICEWRALRHRE